MKRLILLWVVALCLNPAYASIEAYQFETAQMESDYNQLINELRCLVCQNQNLAGSDADLAKDLRRETYQMISEGKSPQQVIDFMVTRYGDFVLYRPQFKLNTYLLWLGPFILLIIVLFFVLRRFRRQDQAPAVTADSLAEARQILEKGEPRK